MANAQLGNKAVGSIVKLKVSGTTTEFIVVHQGKPSGIYDESCNGTWLLMKDIYKNGQWHTTNIREYQYSDIHNYLNGTFFNLFDENIRGSIKQVKIPYVDTPDFLGTVAIKSGANGLPCKIFPLSGYEVGWTEEDGRFWADGAKLDYFAAGTGTSANRKRIAKLNGSDASWWLRSPYTNNKDTSWYVSQNGSYGNDTVTMMRGIRPALVLPFDALVDDSGNVTPPPPPATHKTLINGTAYEVKGGKCLVNGTVYNIKKGRTLIGGTGYDITFAPPYDPVFANNTWEQIIEACHNNAVPDTWKVADQKPMTINGADYLIDIIGKNHDTYTAGGKAPLTFQMHDCYGTTNNMNGSNKVNRWQKSDMRLTHLSGILALMPTEVQSGIREVNKRTSEGNRSPTIKTTADKLFLLSEIEIFGSTTYSFSGEGTQYDYYKAGNSKQKKNYISGNYITWWGRSPHNNTVYNFCCVNSNSNSTNKPQTNMFGVTFGFCF